MCVSGESILIGCNELLTTSTGGSGSLGKRGGIGSTSNPIYPCFLW